MENIEAYRAIYQASFRRSRTARTQWFFDRLLRSDSDVRVSPDAKSGMIARVYPFVFHGRELPLLNISRAVTVPGERRQGRMTALMNDVLIRSADAGIAFASLTPPGRRLYFFFDRFGFATAASYAEERYAAGHTFRINDCVEGCEPSAALLRAIAAPRGMTPLLGDSDFRLLCEQLALDDGMVVAETDAFGGGAILFAGRPDPGEGITVHALVADSTSAAEAALASLLAAVSGPMSLTLRRDAAGAPRARLRAGAMFRIVNAAAVLSAVAACVHELSMLIRIHDGIIACNNADFRLAEGRVVSSRHAASKADLEVSISTLAYILFGEPHVGDIFDLPACRIAPLILPG